MCIGIIQVEMCHLCEVTSVI